MLTSLPRILRISRSGSVSRLRPCRRIDPAILPGGCAISRRIDIAVTDFPQPLSPTTARVSPSSTWNETPSTARLIPSGVRKWVCRLSTSSRAMMLRQPGIEGVAQSVAQQVHRKHGGGEEDRREEHDERLHLPQGTALGHDV